MIYIDKLWVDKLWDITSTFFYVHQLETFRLAIPYKSDHPASSNSRGSLSMSHRGHPHSSLHFAPTQEKGQPANKRDVHPKAGHWQQLTDPPCAEGQRHLWGRGDISVVGGAYLAHSRAWVRVSTKISKPSPPRPSYPTVWNVNHPVPSRAHKHKHTNTNHHL